MSINKYFHDELTALRTLGAEFADSNPRLAPFLATEAQDPDVERLLEGFAFLTGRLRQKLEDELPELTHSVMNLLWPNFLKPVPSLSMIQMSPIEGLTGKKQVKRESMVLSTPVDGTRCQFKTCFDVDLYPLVVSDIVHATQSTGSSLSIQLSLLDNKANFSELSLDYLRFHLFGDLQTSHQLYLYFCRYLHDVRINIIDTEGNQFLTTLLANENIQPAGFSDNEYLLPYSESLFNGYRILQDYFSLPEKYLGIDFKGLNLVGDKLKELNVDNISKLELQCSFCRTFDAGINIGKENLKLYCTPVINLFRHKSAPIQLDHKKTSYRLLPSAIKPKHYEVYHVKKVEGWGHSDHKRKTYPYFESFKHSRNDSDLKLYYQISVKESQDGQALDSYISFVNQTDTLQSPQEETIEASLICTNRNLPVKIGVGDINMPGEGIPEYVAISNISQVTPEFIPPMNKGFHWQLISNMSLNYQSLIRKDVLRVILSTYDYRSYYDRQQARASQLRLEGIDSINVERVDRLFHGRPVRGIRTTIKVLESRYANEGEMFLFFTILNEFFSLYASLNSFHELTVQGIEQGEVYQWSAKIGQQPII